MADWGPATYTVADCKVGMLIEAGVGGPEYPRGWTPKVCSARRALGRSGYCGCEIRTYTDEWGDVRPLRCHHEDARQARSDEWSRAMTARNEAEAAARLAQAPAWSPRGTFSVIDGEVHMTPFEHAASLAPDPDRERLVAEGQRRQLVKDAALAVWEAFECVEPLSIAGLHRIKSTPAGALALEALIACGVLRQTPGFYPQRQAGRSPQEACVKTEISRLAYRSA